MNRRQKWLSSPNVSTRRKSDGALYQPFLLVVNGWLVVAALSALPFNNAPTSLAHLLPGVWTTAWSVLILLSSAAILFSLVWRDDLIALPLRWGALFASGSLATAYAIAVFNTGAPRSFTAGCFILGMGTADMWEAWLLYLEDRRRARSVYASISEHHEMDELIEHIRASERGTEDEQQ